MWVERGCPSEGGRGRGPWRREQHRTLKHSYDPLFSGKSAPLSVTNYLTQNTQNPSQNTHKSKKGSSKGSYPCESEKSEKVVFSLRKVSYRTPVLWAKSQTFKKRENVVKKVSLRFPSKNRASLDVLSCTFFGVTTLLLRPWFRFEQQNTTKDSEEHWRRSILGYRVSNSSKRADLWVKSRFQTQSCPKPKNGDYDYPNQNGTRSSPVRTT